MTFYLRCLVCESVYNKIFLFQSKAAMSSNHHMGRTSPPTGEIDHMNNLSEHIGGLYLNEDYSDIILKVDDQRFHAHKVILAARSEYFR